MDFIPGHETVNGTHGTDGTHSQGSPCADCQKSEPLTFTVEEKVDALLDAIATSNRTALQTWRAIGSLRDFVLALVIIGGAYLYLKGRK